MFSNRRSVSDQALHIKDEDMGSRIVSDGLMYKMKRKSVFDTNFDPSLLNISFDFMGGNNVDDKDEFKDAYDHRSDLPNTEAKLSTSSLDLEDIRKSNMTKSKIHARNGSESSTASNSSTVTLTPSSVVSKDQRFVRYAMSTQAKYINNKWNIVNVVKWLDSHGFNNSWKETFKRNEISGNRFLELVNYDADSITWKQLTKYLVFDDTFNTIERFNELLRDEAPDLDESEELSIAKKSNVFRHKPSNSSSNLAQRPYSYIDPNQKEPSTKFFRKHLRHGSGESLTSKEKEPRVKSYYPGMSLSPEDAVPNRKSRIFSTFRKYGSDKASGIVKQVQTKNNRASKVDTSPVSPASDHKPYDYVNMEQSLPPHDISTPSNLIADVVPPAKPDLMFTDENGSSTSLQLLDERFLPLPLKVEGTLILVSKDSKSFTLVHFTKHQINNVDTIKSFIIKELGIVNIGTITFHVTDINHQEGDALPDEYLKKVVQLGQEKLLVRQELSSPNTNTIYSTTSSDSKSFEARSEGMYPATPQYLLQNNDKVDYLNFKEAAENLEKIKELPLSLKKSTPTANLPFKLTFPNKEKPKPRVPMLQINTDTDSLPVDNPSPSESFKVLRKTGREIDFDQRRKSPFESKTPKRIPNIYSSSAVDSVNSPISSTTLNPLKDIPIDNKEVKETKETKEIKESKSNRESKGVPERSDSFIARRAAPPPPPNRLNSNQSRSLRNRAVLLGSTNSWKIQSFNANDLFRENDIKFDSANIDKDNESETDFFIKPLVSSHEAPNEEKENEEKEKEEKEKEEKEEEEEFFIKPLKKVINEMRVRPPVEELYNNLERYFPNTNLDKPIIDDSNQLPISVYNNTNSSNNSLRTKIPSISRTFSNANISPVNPTADQGDDVIYGDHGANKLNFRRMKTIRVVANEARRKRLENPEDIPAPVGSPAFGSLRRSNTKMWGQKVVEVTPKEIEKGFVSKLRNNKNGEYEEIAWIKGELIGRGSFGLVYIALNVTTGEMIAVKEVIVLSSFSAKAKSKTYEALDALHKEVETMKDLDHINIVQYLGFEQKNNTYSLFLEYVAGGSISSCLKSYGAFEEPLVRFIIRQVLQGLEYLHGNGILHRDLKADNLLLDIDGTCKISDFGISKRSKDIYANNDEMSMQGTVFWMAPEVIDSIVADKKQGYSAKIDIWSLGCVVLEMFAGKRPWSNEAVISAIYKIGKTKLAPPIPENIQHVISSQAKDFINKCFTIDPELRPTAKELLNHGFLKFDNYNFANTKLAELIKYNRKVVGQN